MSRKNTILHKAITSAERLIEFYGHLNMNMEASGLVTVLHKKFENLVAP